MWFLFSLNSYSFLHGIEVKKVGDVMIGYFGLVGGEDLGRIISCGGDEVGDDYVWVCGR